MKTKFKLAVLLALLASANGDLALGQGGLTSFEDTYGGDKRRAIAVRESLGQLCFYSGEVGAKELEARSRETAASAFEKKLTAVHPNALSLQAVASLLSSHPKWKDELKGKSTYTIFGFKGGSSTCVLTLSEFQRATSQKLGTCALVSLVQKDGKWHWNHAKASAKAASAFESLPTEIRWDLVDAFTEIIKKPRTEAGVPCKPL